MNVNPFESRKRMPLPTKTNGMFQVVSFAAVVALWLLLSGGLASTANAQQATAQTPQFEASGAYSYIRANADGGGGFNVNGGSGSFTYNYSEHFSVVADGGIYSFSGLGGGLSSTMYTYVFGPRYSFRKSKRLTPFAQVLFGGGRVNASSSGINAGENGFAMVVGEGLDLTVKPRIAIRLIEADYLLTRFAHPDGSSAGQNNLRISAGVVFRFGSR